MVRVFDQHPLGGAEFGCVARRGGVGHSHNDVCAVKPASGSGSGAGGASSAAAARRGTHVGSVSMTALISTSKSMQVCRWRSPIRPSPMMVTHGACRVGVVACSSASGAPAASYSASSGPCWGCRRSWLPCIRWTAEP